MARKPKALKCFEDTPPDVSVRMRHVKGRGTGLEKSMAKILDVLRIKYEEQVDLPGTPDFRIKNTTVLIFCDSSFWHGRREREVSGNAFKRNRLFWTRKLKANRRRDQRVNRKLRRMGWSVQRFWDVDVLNNPEKVTRRLRRIVNGAENK